MSKRVKATNIDITVSRFVASIHIFFGPDLDIIFNIYLHLTSCNTCLPCER